jgi:hypothetical protein
LEARDGGLDRFEDIKRTEQSKEVENSSELGFSTDDNSEAIAESLLKLEQDRYSTGVTIPAALKGNDKPVVPVRG